MRLPLILLAIFAGTSLRGEPDRQPLPIAAEKFTNPPLECMSRPLWFWNKPDTTADEIQQIMTQSRDQSGYYGFGILPAVEPEKYLSESYFTNYGVALQTAARLGQKMCLYDEYWFPSGSAGGQFAKRFPNLVMKRLDMQAADVKGPTNYSAALPPGIPMGVAAMNLQTRDRIDISRCVTTNQLNWEVPEGSWKIMFFTCVPEGNLMDYMNREATERFLQITHEEYYKRFAAYFGTTIDRVFYDEPTLYRNDGRAWTETFNVKFERKFGHSPVTLYPALWMDIGPETQAARVALFGFRAELFATDYIGRMDEWCRAHRVQLTGHMDQEQVENVTLISGDLLKAFQHQSIPGIDEVFEYKRTQRAYKIISSAAYNWDRELVMSETYGGIGKMPVAMLYRMAMDLYAKGINTMVPHAVWTDTNKVVFQPELSWRNETYGPALQDYNLWIARLNLMLQGGRHVADIAVLYPVAALQAGTQFGVGKPYDGGPVVPEADYMQIGEMLSLGIRHDFTFLHPEALDGRCALEGKMLHLTNQLHSERYRVLMLPGAATAYASNLAKARQFFKAGGTVIATTQLPLYSAEPGKNEQIRQDVERIFGIQPSATNAPAIARNANSNGGRAIFIKTPDIEKLRAALVESGLVFDVTSDLVPPIADGNLSYIHLSRADREVYFFANSSLQAIDMSVTLRGRMNLEVWDPHSGTQTKTDARHEQRAGEDVTITSLHLRPCQAIFVVGKGF